MNTETLQKLLDDATPGPWVVEENGPSWGWVEVKGPSFKVSGPTQATDLTYEDTAIRKNDARLIALAPELAAEVIRLREDVRYWKNAAFLPNYKPGGDYP